MVSVTGADQSRSGGRRGEQAVWGCGESPGESSPTPTRSPTRIAGTGGADVGAWIGITTCVIDFW